jgi:hypothetical protein
MHHRLDRIAFALYAPVALALAFVDFSVRPNIAYVAEHYIPGVLAGTYEAPFIYRPLAPLIAQFAASLTGADLLVTFEALRLLTLFAALVAFHVYLRGFFSPRACLGATLALAATLPLTLTNSWPVPGTYLELALFSLGCLAVAKGRDGFFAVLLLPAVLNRETAAFLLVLWVAVRAAQLPLKQWLPRAALLGTAVLAIGGGIRWVYGFKTYKVVMLQQNLAYLNAFDSTIEPRLRLFGWFWLIMLALPVTLAWRATRRTDLPVFARQAFYVGLLLVATSLVAASIVEPRVLIPALVLFAPAALYEVSAVDAGNPTAQS